MIHFPPVTAGVIRPSCRPQCGYSFLCGFSPSALMSQRDFYGVVVLLALEHAITEVGVLDWRFPFAGVLVSLPHFLRVHAAVIADEFVSLLAEPPHPPWLVGVIAFI